MILVSKGKNIDQGGDHASFPNKSKRAHFRASGGYNRWICTHQTPSGGTSYFQNNEKELSINNHSGASESLQFVITRIFVVYLYHLLKNSRVEFEIRASALLFPSHFSDYWIQAFNYKQVLVMC